MTERAHSTAGPMPLAGPLLALVMFSSQLMGFSRGPLNPLIIAILLLSAFWLLDRMVRPRLPVRSPVFVALVAGFLATAALSAVGEIAVVGSVILLIPKLALTILLVQVIDDQRRMNQALGAFITACAIAGAAGIGQVLVYNHFGVEYSLGQGAFSHFITPSGLGLRATGFARWPDQFAEPLCIASVLTLYLAGAAANRRQRLLFLGVAALTLGGIYMAIVRASWVGVVAGLVFIPLVRRPSLRTLAAETGVIGFLFASGLIGRAFSYISHLGARGLPDRIVLIRGGLEVLASHPWNGVGLNGFGDYSPTPQRYPVHNAFLQIGSELGLPGMIVFGLVVAWVGLRLIDALQVTRDERTLAQLKALLLAYIALLVMMQSGPLGYGQFSWIYFALAEAAAAAALRREGVAHSPTLAWLLARAQIPWQRRGLVSLTTAAAALTALVVSLAMPPVYAGVSQFYVADALVPLRRYSGQDVPMFALEQDFVMPPLGGERDLFFEGLLESETLRKRIHAVVPEKPLEELAHDVAIDPIRYILRVRVEDRDPELAARVANAYPEVVDKFLTDIAAPHIAAHLDRAKQGVDEARVGLERSTRALHEYLTSSGTPDFQMQTEATLGSRGALAHQLDEARAQLQATESRILASQQRLKAEGGLVAQAQQILEASGAHELVQEITRTQDDLADASERGQDARVRRLRVRIADNRRRLTAELTRLVAQTQRRSSHRSSALQDELRRDMIDAYVDRAALEVEIASISRVLQRVDATAKELPERSRREEELRADVSRFQHSVDESELNYAEASAQVIDRPSQSVVMSRAQTPTAPLYPWPQMSALFGACFGFLAGIGFALAGEYGTRFTGRRRSGESAAPGPAPLSS